ncbi:glycosyltransferase family 2 protein [Agathobacter sp.]
MISVIVPVYNVEKYLEKCIESILHQTYKDFELVLIDDGSSDSSGIICDEYGDRDNIVIVHKTNGGLADARNRGIEISRGDYITFIDSDDYIRSDYLETLYEVLCKTDVDIVISNFINIHEGKNITQNITKNLEYGRISKSECYRRMLLQDGIDVSSTAKLYSKRIFDAVRFKKGQLYEDINIISDVVERATNIAITNYAGYFYLQRLGSIMYSEFKTERLVLLDATNRLINLMKERYPENVEAAMYRDIYCTFHLLGRSIVDNKYTKISSTLRKKIINNRTFIFNSCLFDNKERIATLILLAGLPVYKFFWKIYDLNR